ncbi:MAG: CRISPR-associated helicase Cas3' [Rhizobiaceae bacterium]|nr:CRISPR-associated helicase Cas3' [Rhizobiaceae bacterium]
MQAWGKRSGDGSSHHLAHHCADVAAVFQVLLAQPVIRRRAEAALGHSLSDDDVECLVALAFMHDLGKLAPPFQAKGWPAGHGLMTMGHLKCGWLRTYLPPTPEAFAFLGRSPQWKTWLAAIFAHHGRPSDEPQRGEAAGAFRPHPLYDWKAEEAVFAQAMLDWFPRIRTARPPQASNRFVHFFCGLLNLADWIGSDARAFPFEAAFRADYWQTALQRALAHVRAIGLEGNTLRLSSAPDWSLISAHPSPRPAQTAVGSLPLDARLVLLESETGSGKTEAALWRFVMLLDAGEVDALYFAVPTRAAARQLHRRVQAALSRMFDNPPEAVLAIAGQAVAGEATGYRLPDYSTLWDDGGDSPARWAAEHSARYLAAQIAIGTVDQVALGGLQVKYAHLRGVALSRTFLVLDEVHASDEYMTQVQSRLVRQHIQLGGHALLMSATLGSAGRCAWFGGAPGDLPQEKTQPYPAVWTPKGLTPLEPEQASNKSVRVEAHSGWSGNDAAALAIAAARAGARVLVIRNTVARAQETFAACRDIAPELLLHVNGQPTLHHSRFAAQDRALLDAAVEEALGPAGPMQGRVIIGTQTLEQSLDIDADLLITDLCPMDVLLQRIGRLHRHAQRARPAGFERAKAVVLCPQDGLGPLARRGENGVGANPDKPEFSAVYLNLAGIAATLEQIETHGLWHILEMNRLLVEAATHAQTLEQIANARGWEKYHQRMTGKALAEKIFADHRILDRDAQLVRFLSDERIQTRLGGEGLVLTLPPGTLGPFGTPITTIALPAHWSINLPDNAPVTVSETLVITVDNRAFRYSVAGLAQDGK